MTDYLFLLENHLDAGQARVVSAMERLAANALAGLWLTGGAVRDLLCSVPIHDFDFTVEHGAAALGPALAEEAGGNISAQDPLGRWVELALEGGISVSVSNARTEVRSQPGGTPVLAPAMIHEDLRRRDFTINAIAISLGRRSRGLLVDPLNGESDIVNRELRTCGSECFFDDPSRIFRLIRFKHAMGFEFATRTATRLETAISEEWHKLAAPQCLAGELFSMAMHPAAAAMVAELDSLGLMSLIHPALTGDALDLPGLARLGETASQYLPPGSPGALAFLSVLLQRLDPVERSAAISACGLSTADQARWHGFAGRVAAIESEVGIAATSPYQIWEALDSASPDEIVAVLHRNSGPELPERIAAFYELYRPEALDALASTPAATHQERLRIVAARFAKSDFPSAS